MCSEHVLTEVYSVLYERNLEMLFRYLDRIIFPYREKQREQAQFDIYRHTLHTLSCISPIHARVHCMDCTQADPGSRPNT